MRTSPARTSRPPALVGAIRRPRPGGFTLLELMLVVGLLGLMLFLGLPAFQTMLRDPLEREVNRLTGVLRLARNEAVLTRTRHRLVFDLTQRTYRVERERYGSFQAVEEPPEFRKHTLPESFELEDMVLYGEGGRRLQDQEVPVLVDTAGFVDPFQLHFQAGATPYTLEVRGVTGRVQLVTGTGAD